MTDLIQEVHDLAATISAKFNQMGSNSATQVYIQMAQPVLQEGIPFIWYQTDVSGIVQTIKLFDGVI